MKSFMSSATKVLIDLPFDDLQPPSRDLLSYWQDVCDQQLGPQQPPIVESSLYYAAGSSDELELVLAYFGQRVMGPSGMTVRLYLFLGAVNP
jgi:hypothetical protein